MWSAHTFLRDVCGKNIKDTEEYARLRTVILSAEHEDTSATTSAAKKKQKTNTAHENELLMTDAVVKTACRSILMYWKNDVDAVCFLAFIKYYAFGDIKKNRPKALAARGASACMQFFLEHMLTDRCLRNRYYVHDPKDERVHAYPDENTESRLMRLLCNIVTTRYLYMHVLKTRSDMREHKHPDDSVEDGLFNQCFVPLTTINDQLTQFYRRGRHATKGLTKGLALKKKPDPEPVLTNSRVPQRRSSRIRKKQKLCTQSKQATKDSKAVLVNDAAKRLLEGLEIQFGKLDRYGGCDFYAIEFSRFMNRTQQSNRRMKAVMTLQSLMADDKSKADPKVRSWADQCASCE